MNGSGALQLSLFGRLFRRHHAAGEPAILEVCSTGAPFERVVYTTNRRIMVSVGDSGRTLRLHAGFRDAPPEVLRAIGSIYAAPSARERNVARRVVRAFLKEIPAPAPRPAPSKRRIPPADRPHLARLQAEFDRVNDLFFAGTLPKVPLALSGRMKRRNGHFCTHPLEIVVSRRLCTEAEPGEAERTLRHEMIHLWQHARGERPDHGRDFRRWAVRLGVHPRATRPVRWMGT